MCWRSALSIIVAFVVAMSSGHGNAQYFAIANFEPSSINATHDHSLPSNQDHAPTTDCMSCPVSACCFLMATPVDVTSEFKQPAIFPSTSERLHSAVSDGPLRPPNYIGAAG